MHVTAQFLAGDTRGCYSLVEAITTPGSKRRASEHARRERTVRLLSLKNSRGRALISLFARKTIRPWHRVLLGAAVCAKKDLCGEENTAGGAVCTRLKERCVGSATTPRLFNSKIDGGTKVRSAPLSTLSGITFTSKRVIIHTSK